MRKMVSIQRITHINPIQNADRIEVARVLGWNIVVGKGDFNVGDKIAYFEVDSLLPESDERFEKFQPRGQKTISVNGENVTGHVLRTIKLRGVISQGLVMSLQELGYSDEQIDSFSIGDDITNDLGVIKWEEPLPVSGGIIGTFDTRFAPKTDAIRAQTLAEKWDEIVSLKWVPTVKVDGTSQTIINDEGKIRFFGHNWEIEDSLGQEIAQSYGLVDIVKDHENMAVQFELVGPGIQKNRLKLDSLRPIVFAVWIKGSKIPREDWDPRLEKIATPVLGKEWEPSGTIDEMIAKVSTLRGNITKDVLDEGIVFHLAKDQETPDWIDRNANFKIVSNKYLTKHNI